MSPRSPCFYPDYDDDHHRLTAAPPSSTGNPNITTSLYRTRFGLFSLTWSRSLFVRSLHLLLHQDDAAVSATATAATSSSLSFTLHIKPFFFSKKRGSKTLCKSPSVVNVFWDFTGAKFGSGPDPHSGFYIAVVIDGEMALLDGDCTDKAYRKTKVRKENETSQSLVFKRDHIFESEMYTTTAKFGGKTRKISINCDTNNNNDSNLVFNVDSKKVLQIKHLQWKFRGNERIEVDGVPIQVSWDVCSWLFQDSNTHNHDNNHAVFMLRFEDGTEASQACEKMEMGAACAGFGMTGIELRKLGKNVLTAARSSTSSSSSSSVSSGGGSSVMEWASSEENELTSSGSSGFSLLVYAWKR